MSNVLVIAEHIDSELRKVTLPVITFAREAANITQGKLLVLILGHNIKKTVDQLKQVQGIDKLLVVDSPTFEHYLAENYAPAIVKVAQENDVQIVCGPASTFGKDLLPRVAAKLDAGMVSDATSLWLDDETDEVLYKRPLWAGNVIATVQVLTPVHVVSVRTSEVDPASTHDHDAEVVNLDLNLPPNPNAEFVSFEQVKSERPELTDASVIVAGGRGLKSADNFQMIMKLADSLNGAVGATRAAVDSGYAPNDWQIGQTGKIVAPNLYIAVAISGAIQHLAGMKGSKTIVAINNTPDAPIFQIADYGLVADAFVAVPELTKLVEEG